MKNWRVQAALGWDLGSRGLAGPAALTTGIAAHALNLSLQVGPLYAEPQTEIPIQVTCWGVGGFQETAYKKQAEPGEQSKDVVSAEDQLMPAGSASQN